MICEIEKNLTACYTNHNIFIVLNSTCIAVKDRRSGNWCEDHYALGECVSILPKERTVSRLKAWKLVLFTFGCRIEIGPIIDITNTTAEQRDYVYNVSPYRHLIGTLLDEEAEPPRRVA